MKLQAPWVNSLSDGIQTRDMDATRRVVTALRNKLQGSDELEQRD
ncbi:hypothetical protein OKW41_000588 [Paraburkholderia sp. UCT70]